jgi:hypothetical protein
MAVDCNEVKNIEKESMANSEAPEPRAASRGPFIEKSSSNWISLFRRGSQMAPGSWSLNPEFPEINSPPKGTFATGVGWFEQCSEVEGRILDNMTSHGAHSLLKLPRLLSPTPRTTGDVSSEVCRTCRSAPFTVKVSQKPPDLIRFASCSHKRMSSFGDLAKSNCRADCGETQNLLAEIQAPLHHGGICWTCTDGASLGQRSTGKKYCARSPGRCLCSQEDHGPWAMQTLI